MQTNKTSTSAQDQANSHSDKENDWANNFILAPLCIVHINFRLIFCRISIVFFYFLC